MSLDQPAAFVKSETTSDDAFLGGRLNLLQPRQGFRAGLDSVLLGAAVGAGCRRLLDLGSGVGTAALVALAHHPGVAATLAETDPGAIELARCNIERNGFSGRAAVVEVDLAASGPARLSAGLKENHYDCIVANPPYFDRASATPASGTYRAGARHMARSDLEQWVRVAAGCASANAEAIFVYPTAGLACLLAVFAPRFGAITVLPLSPRAAAPASRILVRGIKGSKAPLTLCATRTLHDASGHRFSPEFDAIFRGTTRLDW
jgi:tRNA1(Val) A37 N6-methylase TrmN6